MTAEAGPNLGLTSGYATGASGWGAALNSDLRVLDAVIFFTSTSAPLNVPPSSPAQGDRYVVGTAPTGAWASNANDLAVWTTDETGTALWQFVAPKVGFKVSVIASGATTVSANYLYADGAWQTTSSTLTSAEIDAAFGSTVGAILTRGPSGWETLSAGTTGQVLETSVSGTGTAAVASLQWVSPSTGSTVTSAALDSAFGSTVGAILTRGPSGWQTLSAGTNGQVLETSISGTGTGAVASLAWATPSSGGTGTATAWSITDGTHTVSNVATLDVPGGSVSGTSGSATLTLSTGAAASSGYRYWRVRILTDPSDSVATITDAYMYSSAGSLLTGSGAAISSGDYSSSFQASYAFDNNASTRWASSGYTNPPVWIGYDFGAGNAVTVAQIALNATTASGATVGSLPQTFNVECSNDGTLWSSNGYYTCATWTGATSQTQTFTVQKLSDYLDSLARRDDIYIYVPGTLTANQVLFRMKPAVGLQTPPYSGGYSAIPGWSISSLGTATASVTVSLTQNGNMVSTSTVAAGSSSGTFYCPVGFPFEINAGDDIRLVAPSSPDATFANVSVCMAFFKG